MGRYSLEPPRRNLVAYHTFDDVEIDRVIDHSPQANDGAVVGDVTFGHTGVVGLAARMKSDENNVQVSGLSDFLPMSEVTASVWGRSERPVAATDNNISATISTSGGDFTLTHSVDEPVTEWQYAALRYDGNTVELWYASYSDPEPRVVDEVSTSGSVDSFDVTVFTNGYGYVDDVRVYDTSLDEQYVVDLHEMAASHELRDEFGEQWPTDGIPFRHNNADFAGTLGEASASTLRELDAMLDARRIQYAAGPQLDRLGEWFGTSRKDGESDVKYRKRIIGRNVAARSSGTFEDILQAVVILADCTEEDVTIQYQTPATAVITLKESIIDAALLTQSEISDLLQDVVPGGHDITVQSVGGTPLTIASDTDVDDPDRALTSDSISTGGVLVSDV